MASKYKFEEYDLIYKKQYLQELKKLTKFLKKYNPKIDHVGSTAVPGLGGKGVIDIIIKIKKSQLQQVKKELVKNKYEHRSTHDDEKRLFYLKIYKSIKGERFVHIHITTSQKTFDKKIKFRDYLINNKKECKEYMLVKKKAVKHCKDDGHLYQKLKSKFMDKIMKKI